MHRLPRQTMLRSRSSSSAHLTFSQETSVDGVFAVGDLRAGSTKRVAAAAGEGAGAVAQIHAYLATQ